MKMPMRRAFPLFLAFSSLGLAQLKFEVASIKPNAASDNRVMIRMAPGGRFTATGISLRMLIMQAYNVRDFQITNLPGWAASERFDINAKADTDKDRLPPEELRPMLKALIEERFQLKSHTESKEMPVYALVPAKGGAKLTESTETQMQIRMGRGQLSGKSVPLSILAEQMSNQLGRKVVDKTGFTAKYDITLEWTPEPGHGGGPGGPPPPPDAVAGAGPTGPSIFTALQEQLGLRLESEKGPVDLLVIDSVAKPTEN